MMAKTMGSPVEEVYLETVKATAKLVKKNAKEKKQ